MARMGWLRLIKEVKEANQGTLGGCRPLLAAGKIRTLVLTEPDQVAISPPLLRKIEAGLYSLRARQAKGMVCVRAR